MDAWTCCHLPFSKHIVGSKMTLRFIDSFRFMASSLEKLASYLDTDKKTIVKREFTDLDEGRLKLLMKKVSFFTTTLTRGVN